MEIVMSITRKYKILLDDNWTLDQVFNKLKRCKFGNNDYYGYGYYRGYKVSTDIVNRDDLYLKIYGINRKDFFKERALRRASF